MEGEEEMEEKKPQTTEELLKAILDCLEEIKKDANENTSAVISYLSAISNSVY